MEKKHTIKNFFSWRMHGTGRVSFRLIGIHGGKLGSSCTSQSGTCPSCDRWSHQESRAIPSKDLRHPFTCEILDDLPINKRQIVCLLMPPTEIYMFGRFAVVARIWGWWSTALYTVTLRHSINRKRRLHRIEFQDQASRGHIPLHGDWKTPPPASSAPPCCSHHLAEAFLGSGSTWMIPLWIRNI